MALIAFIVAAVLFLLVALELAAISLAWGLFFTAVGLALMAAGYNGFGPLRR